MKLSISNILWEKGRDALPAFLDAAAEHGLAGVELALNAVFPEPTDLSAADLGWLRAELRSRRLEISALHALTFTRPDLELFGAPASRRSLEDYVAACARIAAELDCPNMVFGSPSARRRCGQSKAECDDSFLEFLRGYDARSAGVRLNIEPLHPRMCEYLHDIGECARLLERGSFVHVGIQLDVRACMDNGEGPNEVRAVLKQIHHCQVSDPELMPIGAAHSGTHRAFAALLREAGYAGFVAGEMRAPPGTSPSQALGIAVASLREFYA